MRWKIRDLVSSAALLVGLVLLVRVGFAFLLEPVRYAREVGYELSNPAAITNTRVSLGGFHLGFAGITAVGLFVRGMRGPVLAVLFLFQLIVVASRIFGILADGFDDREWLAITGEGINFTVLAIANIVYFGLYPRRPQTS